MAEKKAASKKGPVIDCKKCTKSFVCVSVCPVNVFEKISDDKCPKVARPQDCIKCMACENNCPSNAIKVS